MLCETKRLIIRILKPEDELVFIKMASDGSLNDIGFGQDCDAWMKDWIAEAIQLTKKKNPCDEYLAYAIVLKDTDEVVGSVGCSYYENLEKVGITYFVGAEYRGNGYAAEAVWAYTKYFWDSYEALNLIATIREENVGSWKSIEKAGYKLTEKKWYKDINDEKEEIYRFYEAVRK